MKTPGFTIVRSRLALGWLNRMVRPYEAIYVRGMNTTSGWMLCNRPDGQDGCIVCHYQGSLIGLLWYRAFWSNDKAQRPEEQMPGEIDCQEPASKD